MQRYTAPENLQYLGKVQWLSRVPLSIKAAYMLVTEMDEEDLEASDKPGYSYGEVKQNSGTIEQRWLVFQSQERRESDLKKMQKKIEKDYNQAKENFKKLSKRDFACKNDATKAANKLLKKYKYHDLTEIEIKAVVKKEEKDKATDHYEYKVEANISACEEKIQADKKKAGRFILATNVLDKEALRAEQMLVTYKNGQQSVERGFGNNKRSYGFYTAFFLNTQNLYINFNVNTSIFLLM